MLYQSISRCDASTPVIYVKILLVAKFKMVMAGF